MHNEDKEEIFFVCVYSESGKIASTKRPREEGYKTLREAEKVLKDEFLGAVNDRVRIESFWFNKKA